MTIMKRQRFEAGVRQDDESWQAYELRWPRYQYEVMLQPSGGVRASWLHNAAHWPQGGVFVPKGAGLPNSRRAKPLDWYNPVPVAAEILLDVQRTPAHDPKALLRFVNKWGILG